MILDKALEITASGAMTIGGVSVAAAITDAVDLGAQGDSWAGEPLAVSVAFIHPWTATGTLSPGVGFQVEVSSVEAFTFGPLTYIACMSPLFGNAVHFGTALPLQFQWVTMVVPPTDPDQLRITSTFPRYMRVRYNNRSADPALNYLNLPNDVRIWVQPLSGRSNSAANFNHAIGHTIV
jgi:hypothetical protein